MQHVYIVVFGVFVQGWPVGAWPMIQTQALQRSVPVLTDHHDEDILRCRGRYRITTPIQSTRFVRRARDFVHAQQTKKASAHFEQVFKLGSADELLNGECL